LEEAKYLFEFGATSYEPMDELMDEMEDKMRYHLAEYTTLPYDPEC
jgi:hypothetical protein